MAVVDSVPPAGVLLTGVVLDGLGVVLTGAVVVEDVGGFDVVTGVVVEEVVLVPPQPATIRTIVSRETAMNSKDLVFIMFAPFIYSCNQLFSVD